MDVTMGLSSQPVGVKRAVYFGQAPGCLIVSLLLMKSAAFLFKSLDPPLSVWLLGIAAALLTVSGALALPKAFALGKAAIVAPLVTSYGVVITLLSWASGEHIILIQFGCTALCVIGVTLSSRQSEGCAPAVHPLRHARGAVVRYQLMAARPLHIARAGHDNHAVVKLLSGPERAGGDGAEIKDGLKIPPLKNCATLARASVMNLGGFLAFS